VTRTQVKSMTLAGTVAHVGGEVDGCDGFTVVAALVRRWMDWLIRFVQATCSPTSHYLLLHHLHRALARHAAAAGHFLRGNEMPGLQLLVQRLVWKRLVRDGDPAGRQRSSSSHCTRTVRGTASKITVQNVIVVSPR